jgi:uncharacterized protein YndB with AHSA1/START domain
VAGHFRVQRRIEAPIDVVWAVVSDHAGYSAWTPLAVSELTVVGDDDPNGVGAVRRLGMWPRFSFERVVEFEPPRHLAYVLDSGLPVRGYRADCDLRELSGGAATLLLYSASWESTPPGLGLAMDGLLRTILSSFARLMDREAVRRVAAGVRSGS